MAQKRHEHREKNRNALVTATLDSIAEIGFARTSVSEIIKRANLSRGMIHLHFESKDRLLEEAVKFASATYFEDLDVLLQAAGESPQERLEAVVRSDLSETVLNEKSIKIWFAFRGEASVSNAIARYSDTRDAQLNDLIYQAFLQIAKETGIDDPEFIARDATHGTLALLEGMWTDFFLHPKSFKRQSALRIVFRFLAAMFPQHFVISGALVRWDKD